MNFIINILETVQIMGAVIPIATIFVLINKEQTKASNNLMVANIGCLIMNVAYFMIMKHNSETIAVKTQYLGDFLFYLFFIRFLVCYMGLDRNKLIRLFTNWWIVFEIVVLMLVWVDDVRIFIYNAIPFEQISKAGQIAVIEDKFNNINYSSLTVILLILTVYVIVRRVRIKKRDIDERRNLSYLIIANLIIILPLIMGQLLNIGSRFAPIFSSVAILLIILRVINGNFLSVLELGREWVIENFDNAFIVADKNYHYLDANSFARGQFEELGALSKGEKLPYNLYMLFNSSEPEIELNGRHFQCAKKELSKSGKVIGYCVILIDITQNYEMMEQLKEAKERAEQANESKSNFLSNMSHEIRTPMNTIVGMTEILLRSNLDDIDRGYLANIKSSGNALLAIINDILDFSKIESGKLEIIEENYEPMSILSDLSMIFLNRIGDKPVDIMFDIDKELPNILYGDEVRIRQIIINIVNNAIKFTESGFVKLSIKVTQLSENDIVNLDFSIKDTGQGIKEEDMDKLFGSFSQVDTKKNRNKEGTGLGLAISKQLVEMMGGQIGVRSEYGKGSEFYFNIQQKKVGNEKAAVIKMENTSDKPLIISGLMHDADLQEGLIKLVEEYGLTYVDSGEAKKQGIRVDYFFMDEDIYQKINDHIDEDCIPHKTEFCVLQNPMKGGISNKNVIVVNKPLYTLNFCQVINHESMASYMNTDDSISFIAPDAKILIVDDNEMNLKVAMGLLQPMKMQIDTASSGKKAIELVQQTKYNIVFMDHMMPIMDGVETTKHIRELDDAYLKKIPIIALSANAISDARENFINAGMDDFVAKPIELKDICAKIKRWLPHELVQKITEPVTVEVDTLEELPVIEGLHVEEGVKNSGGIRLFISLLGDFYKLIDIKSTKIEKCLADGLIRDYTIEVHALKNTARMIGALELSDLFYKMEQCGNTGDVETIMHENPAIMEMYRSLKPVLEPYGRASEQDKMQAATDEIIAAIEKLSSAMDSFDLDRADEELAKLDKYRLPKELEKDMDKLRAYVADVAMEEVMAVCGQMIEKMKEREDK